MSAQSHSIHKHNNKKNITQSQTEPEDSTITDDNNNKKSINNLNPPDPENNGVSGKTKTKKNKNKKKRKASELETMTTTNEDDNENSLELVVELNKEKKTKKKKAKSEESFVMEKKVEDPNAVSKFKISEPLREKLKEKGIESLFPIQAMTFDIILHGSDLVGRARTGQVSFSSRFLFPLFIIKLLKLCVI
jgi:ATP-dependent RNA helicase DDX21